MPETGSVPFADSHVFVITEQFGSRLKLVSGEEPVAGVAEDGGGWTAVYKDPARDIGGDWFPGGYGLVFNSSEPFSLVPFL